MLSDVALAVEAAQAAGDLLMRGRGQTGAAGDQASDRLITDLLSSERPNDAVLSEETGTRGDRHRSKRVWIVDPLDGTREYAEVGRDDWAVHVALWTAGNLAVGAVAIPARDEVWSTAGAAAIPPVSGPVRRIVVSRTRAPQWAPALAAELGAQLIPLGSAGAKVAALLRGDADAYLHDGGQYEWDSAAPVVVARHHGWSASRIDGADLHYNQPDPYLPDLLICRFDAASTVIAAVAAHRATAEAAR